MFYVHVNERLEGMDGAIAGRINETPGSGG